VDESHELDPRARSIKILICPAHDPYEWTQGVAVAGHFYNVSGGPPNYYAPTFNKSVAGADTLGLSTYGGCMGAWGAGTDNSSFGGGIGFNTFKGVFSNRSATQIARIQDGTSNTLMFGEGAGVSVDVNPSPTGPPAYSATWMGFGGLPTVGGLPTNQPYWFQYSSRHPSNVVQFCFADGSVHSLTPGNSAWPLQGPFPTDWLNFQKFAGYRDGMVQDTSAFLP